MSIKLTFSSKQAEAIFWSPADTFKDSNRSNITQVVTNSNKEEKVNSRSNNRNQKRARSSYPAQSLFAKFDQCNTNKVPRVAATAPHRQRKSKPTAASRWPIRRRRRRAVVAAKKMNPSLGHTIICPPVERVSQCDCTTTPPGVVDEHTFTDEETQILLKCFGLNQQSRNRPFDKKKPVVYQNASFDFGDYVESHLLDGLVVQTAKYTSWDRETPVVALTTNHNSVGAHSR